MREASRSNFLVGLATLLLVGAAGAAHAACGDLNNNGGIDAGDAVVLSQYLGAANMICDGPNPDCDLNGDSAVDAADLLFLLNVVAGVETLTAPCVGLGPLQPCGTVLHGNITSNRRLQGGCTHEVDGTVTIQPNVTLTVGAGATVEGRVTSSDSTPSVLIVVRDGKLNAPGTSGSPIVFTSDASPGSKDIGDWGGILLNGRAPVNVPGGVGSSEGLPPGQALFGGNEPNDSSGLFTFVRVEFSGIEFSPDNELNVFTQNGIGAGTLIQNVQANIGFDDCFEWFGGTVEEKFLVASGCRDDLFDWQLGYRGAVQFGLGVQNAGVSTGGGRNGFESDNNENGFDFQPRSNPMFCNMTLVGSKGQNDTVDGRAGANLRRGTAGTIANSLIMDWSSSCIDFDNDETAAVACDNSTTLCSSGDCLVVQDTICYNNGDAANAPVAVSPTQVIGSATTPCTPAQFYGLLAATEGLLPASPTSLGPAPGGGFSDAYPVSSTTTQYFPANAAPYTGAPNPPCEGRNPNLYDAAPYVGAFDPGNNPGGNWLSSPWVSFAVN